MGGVRSGFYVTGGSLRADTRSYVQRDADEILFSSLMNGEFCYILTARQMGKSSLMVRTSVRLREVDVHVAVLDLTALGQNLNAEQWYYGLVCMLGERFGLEDKLDAYFLKHEGHGPLRRFMAALRYVLLPSCAGRVVIFVDEIDIVRSLPFSTDEFFAAIRECYNRRTEDAEMDRLTFCLLGVAAPIDLIEDTRMTPFNIGRRIELDDFTSDEAAPLSRGLSPEHEVTARGTEQRRRSLLERILHWTGGHPYLTQRLCLAVADWGEVSDHASPTPNARHPTRSDVDRLCTELFISHRAQERDDNLTFVRDRLLYGESDAATLLELYRQVWSGKRIPDDDTDRLAGVLRLAGIARSDHGRLRVRNRIYERVFNSRWVRRHLPGAELQRQKAAYRLGWARALTASTMVVAATGVLAVAAFRYAALARSESRIARDESRAERRSLYVADMNLAGRAVELHNLARARELLERHRPTKDDEEDLRGFEWRLLWAECRPGWLYTLGGGGGPVITVAYSPDGRTIASGCADGTIQLWDVVSRMPTAHWKAHSKLVDFTGTLHYSPDGSLLVSAGWDHAVKLWNTRTYGLEASLLADSGVATDAEFSPNARRLATCGDSGIVRIWDTYSHKRLEPFRSQSKFLNCVRHSPDGRLIAAGSDDGIVRLWNVRSHRIVRSLPGVKSIESMAFSHDGKTLAVGQFANSIDLWDVATGRQTRTLSGHAADVAFLEYSSDGKLLATASKDGTARIWDAASGKAVRELYGHRGSVDSVGFSPDHSRVATASEDGSIAIWDTGPQPDRSSLRLQQRPILGLVFSPNGKLLAAGGAGSVRYLIDVDARHVIARLQGNSDTTQSVAFSRDGRTLAAATGHVNGGNASCPIELWDVLRHRLVRELVGHEGAISCVKYSPDGSMLAACCSDGAVSIWEPEASRPKYTIHLDKRETIEAAFSPDGAVLALAGGGFDHVELWDVAGRRKIRDIQASDSSTISPVFSPNGKLLAFSDFTGVRIVDLDGMVERAVLSGHVRSARAIAFSPDSKTLASCGIDGTTRLWNLATMSEVWVFRGDGSEFSSIAFSPDGNHLAAGCADGTIRFWDAEPSGITDSGRQ